MRTTAWLLIGASLLLAACAGPSRPASRVDLRVVAAEVAATVEARPTAMAEVAVVPTATVARSEPTVAPTATAVPTEPPVAQPTVPPPTASPTPPPAAPTRPAAPTATPGPLGGELGPGGTFARFGFDYPGDRSVYTVNLHVEPDDASLLKNAGFVVYGPGGEEIVRGGAQPGLRPNVSADVIHTRPGRYLVQVQNYDPARTIRYRVELKPGPPPR